MGGFHSSGYSLRRKVTGDFHRPYETQNVLHFTVLSKKHTPPQSDWLTGPYLGGRDYHMEGIYVRRNENHTGIRR